MDLDEHLCVATTTRYCVVRMIPVGIVRSPSRLPVLTIGQRLSIIKKTLPHREFCWEVEMPVQPVHFVRVQCDQWITCASYLIDVSVTAVVRVPRKISFHGFTSRSLQRCAESHYRLQFCGTLCVYMCLLVLNPDCHKDRAPVQHLAGGGKVWTKALFYYFVKRRLNKANVYITTAIEDLSG